ncbi:MAG TPA: DNA primase, partial [Candidatus Binataceae bacterium]
MPPISDTQIEEVRSRADIVEIIGTHVRLRKAGRNFVGLCPFHGEKTPSFTVNREKGFFHCFGCGVGGTVFNFLMKMDGATFPEAVRSLAGRYGITIAEETRRDPRALAERDAMLRAAEVAGEFFAHVLWEERAGAIARDYLKKRGIDIETAKAFKLGFAPASAASLAAALTKRGLLDAGLRIGVLKGGGPQPADMFYARLMFPIHDAAGRVIAFGGRVLDDRLPKYINSPESPLYSKARNLYGLAQARAAIAKADRAIVVEGYIDAIALAQAGFKETVASLGTALTVDQLRLLGRYSRNVFACFDGDKAGHSASIRAFRTFLEGGIALGRGVFLPDGFDPDTLVRKQGAESFRKLLNSAELLVDYFVHSEVATIGASLSDRARAAERVAELLALVRNPFEFNLLTRKADGFLKVGEEVLRAHGRKETGLRRRSAEQVKTVQAIRKDRRSVAEIGLLTIAVGYPELRGELIGSGVLSKFGDSELAVVTDELCRLDKNRAQAQEHVM